MRLGGVVLRALVVMWFSMACFPLKVATAALTLKSSFNVSQTYTDNLFFDDKNTKNDFGTLLGPDFILQYDNPDIVSLFCCKHYLPIQYRYAPRASC